MKRALALILIFFQCMQPANAAGFFDGLGDALKSQVSKAVVESLANGFGVATVDPKAERAMDDVMQEKAEVASTLFQIAGQGSAQAMPTGAELYDPSNLDQSKQQINRWKNFVAKTRNKKMLSDEELKEAAKALLPMLRYYNQGSAVKPDFYGNVVMVPTGQTVRINLQGYCMDRSIPAPSYGEKLQLVPIQKLIPQEAVALYQAMMQFSATHVDKRSEMQNLVWGLRHAADPYPPIKELNASQVALLDEAMPNGAALYRMHLAKQAQTGKDLEARKQLFRNMLSKAQTKYNITLPDPSTSGYTPSDSNALVAALSRMPVEGTPQAHSEYSLLATGIAAKTVANGLQNISLEIRNTTPQPFLFDANQYVGQSTRVSQRVAFGGLLGRTVTDNRNLLQRLHDILQLLEIPRLKNLQSQIQHTIDASAEKAGNSNLKFAGLALATALNQVILPTSAVDLALLSGGKLLGAAEKLTYKEVAVLEGAVADLEKGVGAKIVGTELPALRQAYVNEVRELEDVGLNARAAGATPEDTARMLSQMRRDLGVEYKNLTPPDELAKIYSRNLETYGDKLGPTIDYMRNVQGKTWEQIIEKAAKPGGKDLGY